MRSPFTLSHHRPALRLRPAASLALAALALILACRGTGVGAGAGAGRATPVRQGAPGFDTGIYPGDAAMRAWAQSSPYRWVGFYLPSPCHRDSSWVGTRARLAALGWSTAVLYVGQQTWDHEPGARRDSTAARVADSTATASASAATAPSCSRTLLSAEQGTREGSDAVAKAAREGFARGTTLFLDIERMDSIPASMRSYYRAWLREVARDGRYRPGLYGHQRNATALFADLRALYAEAGLAGAPPFWVAYVPATGFSLERRPADSGVAFATIWQGRINVRETWGGHTLAVDVNVADALP